MYDKKILIPLDGSTFAERALPYAASLAEAFGAGLVLLTVFQKPRHVTEADTTRQMVEMAAHLHTHVEALRSRGVSAESILIEGGDVAHLILQSAESHLCDLIVMTTHGRSGLARWRLGSIAERVVRHASQSVLVVKSADPDDDSQAVQYTKRATPV